MCFWAPHATRDGTHHLRQFHDMKGALDITGMSPSAFSEYVPVCAQLLARAHAQKA